MKRIFLLCSFFLVFKTQAQVSTYYTNALGKTGNNLFVALHNIIKGHNIQSWPLWNHFVQIDSNGNFVYDMYSTIPGGINPYQYQFIINECGTYNAEGDCYNHEHAWPKSYFNDAMPMYSDLHHILPTDGWVNNKRGNLPYGETSSTTWTSQNGSKLGNSTTFAAYSGLVFEPIDSFKGDIARIYFYMSTRYYTEDNAWSSWPMAIKSTLNNDAITLLLKWHHDDPVSIKEIKRNNGIYSIQGNRNPFVDYPLFADCIWGNVNCTFLAEQDVIKYKLDLFPNPCNEKLQIKGNEKISSWQILNIYGQKILTGTKTNIDVSSLATGQYAMLVQVGNKSYKKIFTKE